MKILIAFPDIPYYNWQVLVQMNNFLKFGFANNIIYVVGKQPNVGLSKQLKTVLDKMPVEYHVYDDTRVKPKYPSSLRPHILAKLFKDNPQYKEEVFFYTDPDMLFTKEIDFSKFSEEHTWYVSNTKSYLDCRYIKSKSEELFENMCEIVGIDKEIVEENDENAGGAQYIMKNLDENYWTTVYNDSEALYEYMKNTESIYNPQHPIQSWTADMWAVLWGAWKKGENVKIDKSLEFSWATDGIGKYERCNLFHNAGVAGQKDLFDKIKYQKSPFNEDFSHVSDKHCSYRYMGEVVETKNNYPELINLF